VFLLALNFAGILSGVYKMLHETANPETLTLNVIWCVLNTIVIAAATAVARESKQKRNTVRITAKIPVSIVTPTGEVVACETIDVSRGGFSVPSIPELTVEPGDRLKAVFQSRGEEQALPCIVIDTGERSARFSFSALTLEQEAYVTDVIFGRADSWLDWRTNRDEDRPLLSFLSIFGIALSGLAAVAGGIIEALKRSPSSSAASRETPEALRARKPALPGVIAVLLGLGLSATYPTNARAQNVDPSSPAFTDTYDLSALGHKESVMLKGSDSRATISFGIPVTKVVTSAALVLSYRASAALSPKSSNINVILNGTSIGAAPLAESSDPEATQSIQVDLPADFLTANNSIKLEFNGKCVPGCLGGTPDTLWMRIEPATQVRLSGSVLAIANNLRLLPAPFVEASQLTAISQVAFAENPDSQTLQAAGVIASWLGMLADFRGIHFPTTLGNLPKGNVIAFAVKGSPLIPDPGINALAGPAIALRDNPSDPYGKVLVITGDNSEQILAAARAVASGRFPRDGDSAELGGIEMPPPRRAYDAPRWLARNVVALNTDDSRIYENGSVDLYFRLPPDISFGTKSYIPFRLNYQLAHWTSGMHGLVRVKLNGRDVTTRRISQTIDQGKQSMKIGLPADQLFSGNTLTVEFTSDAERHSGPKAAPEETVLRDSAIDLSGASHYVEMPRLDLFANAGFPFTRFADLSDTAVVLPREFSAERTSLYLALLGFFGARTGYPGLRVTVTTPGVAANLGKKHLLVIGSTGDESSSALAAASPARMESGSVRIVPTTDWFSFLPWRTWGDQTRKAQDVLSSDPPPVGYLTEFASPFSNDNAVVSFQASDVAQFPNMEDVFAENSRIADIYGNLSLLQDKQFHSFTLQSNVFSYGTLRWDDQWRTWLRNHSLVIPIILLLACIFLASQLNVWLEVRAKLRLQARC
jgi:cellulose synthase (UDP-forming)